MQKPATPHLHHASRPSRSAPRQPRNGPPPPRFPPRPAIAGSAAPAPGPSVSAAPGRTRTPRSPRLAGPQRAEPGHGGAWGSGRGAGVGGGALVARRAVAGGYWRVPGNRGSSKMGGCVAGEANGRLITSQGRAAASPAMAGRPLRLPRSRLGTRAEAHLVRRAARTEVTARQAGQMKTKIIMRDSGNCYARASSRQHGGGPFESRLQGGGRGGRSRRWHAGGWWWARCRCDVIVVGKTG